MVNKYLHGITHILNPRKYYIEKFLTSNIATNKLAFTHAGPFIQPLPTRDMCSREQELANMPFKDKDVKCLVTLENFRLVGRLLDNQDIVSDHSTNEANTTDQ